MRPEHKVGAAESQDIRWLTLEELRAEAERGEALQDVVNSYEFLLNNLSTYVEVEAESFSLDKPTNVGVTYKRGGVKN